MRQTEQKPAIITGQRAYPASIMMEPGNGFITTLTTSAPQPCLRMPPEKS